MTEKSARKLGEVLAFAEVSLDTATKAMEALREVYGEDLLSRYKEYNTNHAKVISEISARVGVAHLTTEKALSTIEKLKTMRDLYVKGEWSNPTELAEWSGFFEGAAIVHWQLVSGLALSLDIPELGPVADDAIGFHLEMLESASTFLKERGKMLEQ